MNVGRHKVRGTNEVQVTGDKTDIAELVKGAGSGDFEAFGELYTIFLERIYRYVYYQVRDKMAAEDLVEEIFMKAWRAIGSYKGGGQSFSSWLYRIAYNHVIDDFRTRRPESSLDTEVLANLTDPTQEVGRGLIQQEVLELISYLPSLQKQVITLKFIEGNDNREIEQITGKSQGAIRVMQMRALSALRQRLIRGKTKNEG